jgi:hypothetical protein
MESDLLRGPESTKLGGDKRMLVRYVRATRIAFTDTSIGQVTTPCGLYLFIAAKFGLDYLISRELDRRISTLANEEIQLEKRRLRGLNSRPQSHQFSCNKRGLDEVTLFSGANEFLLPVVE